MWNDRPARRPIVGDLDKLEEMDVCLSVPELRDMLSTTDAVHLARLLSGQYLIEPWLRVRVDSDGDWICAWGIEVMPDADDGGMG